MRPLRRDLQIIFQDPLASLDPRMTVGEIVAEPLRVHRRELNRAARQDAVAQMLERVGLSRDVINRYPHEFSGGQCQRIGIARAMIVAPKLLICDEPVSALDVSIQAQIVNLLKTLQRDTGMSIIFVSHNLAVVRRICNRVLVLYLGRVMELAATDDLYQQPLHPYTRGLLEAVPLPDPQLQPLRLGTALRGELPSPLKPPSGCVFRTRCPHAEDRCAQQTPELEMAINDTATQTGHQVACLRWREILT
jgi:oligopeptide transport system ATP-binding protein